MSDMWKGWTFVSGLGDESSDCCRESTPGGRYGCTRDLGHAGRHLAGGTGALVVLAAWPGTHEPTEADLHDPTPDGVVIPVASLPTHAGDEVARLQAEVERLAAESEKRLQALIDVRASREEAEREVERLRGILTRQVDTLRADLSDAREGEPDGLTPRDITFRLGHVDGLKHALRTIAVIREAGLS